MQFGNLTLDRTAAAGQVPFAPFDLLPTTFRGGPLARFLRNPGGTGQYALRADIGIDQLYSEAVGKRDCGWKLADLRRTGWHERSD